MLGPFYWDTLYIASNSVPNSLILRLSCLYQKGQSNGLPVRLSVSSFLTLMQLGSIRTYATRDLSRAAPRANAAITRFGLSVRRPIHLFSPYHSMLSIATDVVA